MCHWRTAKNLMSEMNLSLQALNIQGLTMDSRRVKPNDLFFAVPGLTVDGRDYIPQAIQQGAIGILKEKEVEAQRKETQKKTAFETTEAAHQAIQALISAILAARVSSVPAIPTLEVPHLRDLIGPIAAHYFAEPSKTLPVIGITGTTGKTSTVHFIAQLLKACQISCGIMGSLGNGYLRNLKQIENTKEAHCTTMDAISIQNRLANFKKEGAAAVAMEVTSHALTQGRVAGIEFESTIFTNLSRDHIDDYHLTMEHYWAAKKSLFTQYPAKQSIINLDDTHGQILFKELKESKLKHLKERQIYGYTIETSKAKPPKIPAIFQDHYLIARDVVSDNAGIRAEIETPWGNGHLQCTIIGQFNLSNILAAIAVLCCRGIPLEQVLTAAQQLQTVPGRMMRFGGKTNGNTIKANGQTNGHADDKIQPLVIVDYAHKPEALQHVLQTVRQTLNRGRVWCVFGCGGDRDRGKRPIMTQVACQLSDYVIVTQDNVRTEDTDQIFADMMRGITQHDAEKITIEPNRRKAIFSTILQAQPEDIIVVAGKGHENYQIIGNKEIYFSDEEEVLKALNER